MLLMISAQSHQLYFWALLLWSNPLLVRLISQFHTPTSVRPMVDFGKWRLLPKVVQITVSMSGFLIQTKCFLQAPQAVWTANNQNQSNLYRPITCQTSTRMSKLKVWCQVPCHQWWKAYWQDDKMIQSSKRCNECSTELRPMADTQP